MNFGVSQLADIFMTTNRSRFYRFMGLGLGGRGITKEAPTRQPFDLKAFSSLFASRNTNS